MMWIWRKCGVYKYARSEKFEILLFACSVNGSVVQVIDLAEGECIPDEILAADEGHIRVSDDGVLSKKICA